MDVWRQRLWTTVLGLSSSANMYTQTLTFPLTLKVEQSCVIAVAAAVDFGTGKGQNDSFSPVFQGLRVSGGCG